MSNQGINRVVIIPARGGSKRIPHKNIFPVLGRPILLRSISILQDSQLFSKILVSTECSETLKICAKNNIEVSGKRPAHLATDTASLLEVLNYEVKKLLDAGEKFDELWLYSATACLLESSDLKKASEKFQGLASSLSLLSVVKCHTPVEWALKITHNELVPLNPATLDINSQTFDTTYFDAGCFAIYSFSNFLDSTYSKTIRYSPFILPRHKGIDVDTLEDISLVEILVRAKANTTGIA